MAMGLLASSLPLSSSWLVGSPLVSSVSASSRGRKLEVSKHTRGMSSLSANSLMASSRGASSLQACLRGPSLLLASSRGAG